MQQRQVITAPLDPVLTAPAAIGRTVAMPARRKLSFRVIDAHIGARLRRRRTELAISQRRLGESCGVAYQQIAKWG